MPQRFSHPGVYVSEISSGSRSIEGVDTNIAAFLGFARKGPVDKPREVHSWDEFQSLFGPLQADYPLGQALSDFFNNGGQQAIVVRAQGNPTGPDLLRRLQGTQAARTGLYALEHSPLFNLLCIPPPGDRRDIGKRLTAAAARFCEKRRAFLLIDPPRSWTSVAIAKQAMIDPLASLGTKSSNAAIFFPRILHGARAMASCGAVAGVIARTDAQRGVWKAPAGVDASLRDVSGFAISMNDAENGELNPLGCNCLREMPGLGPLVWGARTLAGGNSSASEWKYISVRRTALYIEESLIRGLGWVVFEPNDEPLWAQMRQSTEGFMMGLFRAGACQGASAKEAFLVKCDAETTTASDRSNGVVNFMVGFAPLKPAEFVILKFQLQAGQH
jgi:Bacteriophage tail sheath protein